MSALTVSDHIERAVSAGWGCCDSPRSIAKFVLETLADEAPHIFAATELLEGAQDAVEAFKLLRIGMQHEPKALEVIAAHIDELEYAIALSTPSTTKDSEP